jgi:L-rhamnose isomerase/sugar isomerase
MPRYAMATEDNTAPTSWCGAARSVDIEDLTTRAGAFPGGRAVVGRGTGHPVRAVPGPGEPRDIFDKLDDCATIFRLVRSTPGVSCTSRGTRPISPPR